MNFLVACILMEYTSVIKTRNSVIYSKMDITEHYIK